MSGTRARFEWLADRRHLRSNLNAVRSALAAGRLNADELRGLAAALDGLIRSGGLDDRIAARAEKVRAAVERALMRAGQARAE